MNHQSIFFDDLCNNKANDMADHHMTPVIVISTITQTSVKHHWSPRQHCHTPSFPPLSVSTTNHHSIMHPHRNLAAQAPINNDNNMSRLKRGSGPYCHNRQWKEMRERLEASPSWQPPNSNDGATPGKRQSLHAT